MFKSVKGVKLSMVRVIVNALRTISSHTQQVLNSYFFLLGIGVYSNSNTFHYKPLSYSNKAKSLDSYKCSMGAGLEKVNRLIALSSGGFKTTLLNDSLLSLGVLVV